MSPHDSAGGGLQAKSFELRDIEMALVRLRNLAKFHLGPKDSPDAAKYFCLAARAAGLGSIPQAAPAGFAPFLRDWFDLPEDRDILCAISFGYPDESAPVNSFRTPRAPAGEIIDWR